MRKEKAYEDIRFGADVVKDAVTAFKNLCTRHKADATESILTVELSDTVWSYDTIEEFFADYRNANSHAHLFVYGGSRDLEFEVAARPRYTRVAVKANATGEIESIFAVFEGKVTVSQLAPEPRPPAPKPIIFIGHGHSSAWRDLKDHLHDKHGFEVEAFETGARAGHAIRDILEDMVSKSSLALLVLSAEDEQADEKLRARQNVIHEAGLFQGRLGFARAILLVEDGVEEFSNVQGIQHISFGNGNIRETFGDVLATLRREFGAKIHGG